MVHQFYEKHDGGIYYKPLEIQFRNMSILYVDLWIYNTTVDIKKETTKILSVTHDEIISLYWAHIVYLLMWVYIVGTTTP